MKPINELTEKPEATVAQSTIPTESNMNHGQPEPTRSPLSFAQQRLWFLEQLHPQSAIYNIPVAAHLRGELKPDALNAAISAVLTRHEILRARVVSIEDEPYQLVGPAPFPGSGVFAMVDLSHLSTAEREDELRRRLVEESGRPFDLANENPVRAILYRLEPAYHVLFLNMHHMNSDAFSFEIFFREISQAYNAYPNDPGLPKVAMQYADYSASQKEKLAGKTLQSHLEFWTNELAHAPEFLDLPGDRPRLATSSHRGSPYSIRLTSELCAGVQQLSLAEKVTPFMLCLAVFKILLFRLTARGDMLVGVPITGRDRPGTECLIGYCSNTVAIRSCPQSNLPFREFLQQVRGATLRAFAHRELPFEKVVEQLRPARRGDATTLVQVMFDMQGPWGHGLVMGDLHCTVEVLSTNTTKFDLSLGIITDPAGWIVEAEFDAELLNLDTVQRWLSHFEVLLEGAVAQPDVPIGKLPVLT